MFIYILIIFIYPIINIEQTESSLKKCFSDLNKNKYNFNLSNINNLKIFSSENKENNDNNKKNITSSGEYIFHEYYYVISCGIFLFGFFIILYGACHYRLALIINFTLFLYYNIVLFLVNIEDNKNYLFILLFSFLSGVFIYIFIGTNDENSKKFIIQIIIYGCIFGCFLFKTIVYFLGEIDFNEIKIFFYYLCFYLSIILGGIANFFIYKKVGNYIYLPCSVISGSFFIIKSCDFIIFSENKKNNENEKRTNIIFLILLIFGSTLYQIYHIKYKEIENPEYFEKEKQKQNDYGRTSEASNVTEVSNLDQEDIQELVGKQKIEEEGDDEEINDQED